jgi:hypothetical protein
MHLVLMQFVCVGHKMTTLWLYEKFSLAVISRFRHNVDEICAPLRDGTEILSPNISKGLLLDTVYTCHFPLSANKIFLPR